MFTNLKTVLIVDDAEDFRVLLSHWISARGLQPITAVNGAEAIRVMKKAHIDLIITDFQMPELDGLDFLQWCRSHSIHVPVIFTSAEGRRFQREEIALGDCCATRLSKPINFKILAAAVDAADRRDHHKDCLHQAFKADVAERFRLSELRGQ